MLYDIHRGEWDEELLGIFRVPRGMLPEVLPSSHIYGATAKNVLGAEIPIAGIAGDQQAALFGQACHEAGMAKNTYGTGCFLLLNTGGQAITSRNGLIATCAAQAGAKQFALEGSVFTGGAVVQWLRDGLRLIRKSVDVEKLAASVPIPAACILFRPSPGSVRRTGTLTRAGLSSVSRAARTPDISRAPLWNRSRSSRRTSCTPWNRTPPRNRKSCASTAARRRTIC